MIEAVASTFVLLLAGIAARQLTEWWIFSGSATLSCATTPALQEERRRLVAGPNADSNLNPY